MQKHYNKEIESLKDRVREIELLLTATGKMFGFYINNKKKGKQNGQHDSQHRSQVD